MSFLKMDKSRPWLTMNFAWGIVLVWTVVISGLAVWSYAQTRRNAIEAAVIQARASFEKDVLYRRWNSMHGGVYARVTDTTLPNPYLDVPYRDITLPSGDLYTLINPAYMTRQVHELGEETANMYGHITSLNPIRPENAADLWETTALQAFEEGATEVYSIEVMEGEEYLRFMQPLITEQSCMKCHAKQGYQAGDIRGGISVAVAMEPFFTIASKQIQGLITVHSSLWLCGLVSIVLWTQRLNIRTKERDLIQQELHKVNEELERRVNIRTADLARANKELENHYEHLEELVAERTNALDKSRKAALSVMQDLHDAQEKLVLKEKMATLGQLGGGVAHELRNPLGVISNAVYFLKSSLTNADDTTVEYLDMISSEIRGAVQIIENLLSLTRKDDPQMEETLVAELVARGLVRRVPPEGVVVSTEISDETLSVLADPSQIVQVMENLLSNAYQAMPDGGELTIKAWEENNNVLISVADTGSGIPEEHLEEIFEPLFTSKARGFGFGLSISRDLIGVNNGSIEVESVVDQGSTFTLKLPGIS